MSVNESTLDRIIRGIAAVLAVIAAIAVGPTTAFGIILFVLAAILGLTAVVGFCPIYRLLGMSTNRVAARTKA